MKAIRSLPVTIGDSRARSSSGSEAEEGEGAQRGEGTHEFSCQMGMLRGRLVVETR
jgi:plastocyanin domain-containing protein